MSPSDTISPTIEEEIIPRKQRVAMGFVCGCIFLLIYALSAGPMVKLLEVVDVKEFQTAVKFFYAPFVFLIENNIEPFASLLKWYISLFQ